MYCPPNKMLTFEFNKVFDLTRLLGRLFRNYSYAKHYCASFYLHFANKKTDTPNLTVIIYDMLRMG